MTRPAWILIIIFSAGLIILLSPDKDIPVIKLNEFHGPSVLDLTGLLLMLAAWLASTIMIFRRWTRITKTIDKNIVYILLAIYLLSVSGIVFCLIFSSEWLLWLCVTIAALINITLLVSALRK
jgi:hypothetical protein